MGAIGRHKTATVDRSWDGPANERRLRKDGTRAYYRSAAAWEDPKGNARTKAAYKMWHHEVSADGTVGAANTRGCSAVIAVLNGGRGGTKIPASDRGGVHAHVAGHLRDAGKEVPPLRSVDTEDGLGLEYRGFLDDLQVRAIDEGARRVEFVAATQNGVETRLGRQYLDIAGLDIVSRYARNSVILDSHPTRRGQPTVLDIFGRGEVRKEGANLIVGVTFAETGRAEDAWQLAKGGFLHAVSVGFIPRRVGEVEGGVTVMLGDVEVVGPATIIREAVLFEVSLVCVPADPDAVRRMFGEADDVRGLATALRHVLERLDGAGEKEDARMKDVVLKYLRSQGLREDADESTAAAFLDALDDGRRTWAQGLQAGTVRADETPPPEAGGPARVVGSAGPVDATEEERRARAIRAIAPRGLGAFADALIVQGKTVEEARSAMQERMTSAAAPVGTGEPQKIVQSAGGDGEDKEKETAPALADVGDDAFVRALGG